MQDFAREKAKDCQTMPLHLNPTLIIKISITAPSQEILLTSPIAAILIVKSLVSAVKESTMILSLDLMIGNYSVC